VQICTPKRQEYFFANFGKKTAKWSHLKTIGIYSTTNGMCVENVFHGKSTNTMPFTVSERPTTDIYLCLEIITT
jgi:hypothetical protein